MQLPPNVEELVGFSGVVTGLDERWVVRHFLGKTRAQMLKAFEKQASIYTEDFNYMVAPGLRYYLPVALAYLQGDSSARDGEFCSGLLCSLSCQAKGSTALPEDVLRLIKEIARYCDTHREKFWLSASEDLFDRDIQAIAAA